MDSSSIDGNADIVKSTSNDNPRSAFFSGGQSFVAPRLDGNDLGLYFDLAFTFQAVQSDNTTRGVLVPSGTNGPLIIALVDNSANNQEATYGCRLQVVRTNYGQVQCYVRPSKASDLNERYDANATSPEVVSVDPSSEDFSFCLVLTSGMYSVSSWYMVWIYKKFKLFLKNSNVLKTWRQLGVLQWIIDLKSFN